MFAVKLADAEGRLGCSIGQMVFFDLFADQAVQESGLVDDFAVDGFGKGEICLDLDELCQGELHLQ